MVWQQRRSRDKPSADTVAAKVRRLNPIKLRQMQERCSFVEEEIPRIESSIAEAEESLGVYESAEETQRVTQLLESLRTQHTRSPPSGKSWCCNWSSRLGYKLVPVAIEVAEQAPHALE